MTTFWRRLFTAFGWLSASVLLLGTVQGLNRLTSIACGIALVSLASSVVAAARIQRVALQKTARFLEFGMTGSLVALFVATISLGGGALSGHIGENGIYYLSSEGQEKPVAPWTYYLVAGMEMSLFAVWPAGMTFMLKAKSLGGAV